MRDWHPLFLGDSAVVAPWPTANPSPCKGDELDIDFYELRYFHRVSSSAISIPSRVLTKVGHVGDEDLARLTNIKTHRRLTEESGYELGTPLWQYEGQTGKSFNRGPMVWARRTQYLTIGRRDAADLALLLVGRSQ
eukprot:scaffold78688_cov59-Attheya_sp.AAC.1